VCVCLHNPFAIVLQAALKNIRMARIGAFAASALCVLLRPQIGLAAAMGGGAAAAGVGTGLGELIGLFYKYEFSHADNN